MSKTALIVLDFINGITGNGDIKSYMDNHQTLAKANQLIQYARKKNNLIIFVKVGFSDSYAEAASNSPLFAQAKANHRLKLSDPSTDFDPALDYHLGDIVVVKHRINAFYATSLEAILNANAIDQLILCGVSTNFAVEGTARDAHDRNYKVIIAKDACASDSEANQEKSLTVINRITTILTVDEICK